MKAYFYGLLLNFQFFSTIPITMEVPMNHKIMERSIRLFPLLGILFGMIYALIAYGLLEYTPFSTLLVTLMIWLLTIVLCGGIHIDAWMDSADAFFSYQDINKRLEIMSDPRIGAFGVLGAIVLLTAKFVFIYEILKQSEPLTFVYIALLPMLSRAMMGLVLVSIINAKDKGLGHLFQQAKTKATLPFYLLYFIFGFGFFFISWKAFIIFLILLCVMLCFFFFVKSKAIKWFGGITGDVVGASTEGVEVLLWFVLLLLHYSGMGLL